MAKAVAHWSDERLNDLAAALESLPARVAVLEATVGHLAADNDRLAAENRSLRAELAATQHQLLQVAWVPVAALIGGTGAVLAALI
jgi:cell shape-determining protein MreC